MSQHQQPQQPRQPKRKKEIKRIIYSNMESDYNCGEECQGKGYCDCSNYALQDEKLNLNNQLDAPILAIAQLGTWRGRRQGYKLLGSNLNDIFSIGQDYNEWYYDGKNILSNQVHHDGRNHILFRKMRGDRTQESIERFLNEVYNGVDITPQKLAAYTTSLGPDVAKIYGW